MKYAENTHRSRKWVPWEIGLAIEERKRVVAMKFWDTANATTPSVLVQNKIVPHAWDVKHIATPTPTLASATTTTFIRCRD